MLQRIFDLAFAIAVLLASVALWIVADGFPTSQKYARVDTDYWPKIVFATLAVLTAVLVVQKILSIRGSLSVDSASAGLPNRSYVLRLTATAGLILGYFIALQWVGFLIATVLFLWAASFVIPYKNLAAKLIFAPVFTISLTLFFGWALKLPLPRGSGVFYDLSLKLF